MQVLNSLEKSLGDLFKGAPKLSDNVKETLAKIWPWLALVFGILQLFAAWGLWHLVRATDNLYDALGIYIGHRVGYSSSAKFFIYLSILALVVDSVLMLMAYPKLNRREKGGWDLIFLATVLNAIYSVFNLFIDGRGFGSFFFALLSSAIAFYFLFQVRDKYKGVGVKTSKTPEAK